MGNPFADDTAVTRIRPDRYARVGLVRGAARVELVEVQQCGTTRQLARRQMKWFRRFPNVKWLPGDAPLHDNVAAVLCA